MFARAVTMLCAFCALAVLLASASAAPKKVMLKFSATTYSVAENAGTFNVTVLRTGNTGAAARPGSSRASCSSAIATT
jgi:hypothetical protein